MHKHSLYISRRKLLLVTSLGALLVACGDSSEDKAKAIAPVEITRNAACALDGMILADYPGPKAQIHYEGVKEPHFFCDTVELFSIYLQPEQARKITAMYVQDMGTAKWDAPVGGWIDAKKALYVVGSSKRGAMGVTFAPFEKEADAQKFVHEYGGTIKKFSEVTPDMAKLDGGALHDHRM